MCPKSFLGLQWGKWGSAQKAGKADTAQEQWARDRSTKREHPGRADLTGFLLEAGQVIRFTSGRRTQLPRVGILAKLT